MQTNVLFGKDALKKLCEGIEQLQAHGIESLSSEDPYVDIGIAMGKEAVDKVKRLCGSGVEETILFLKALVREGVELIARGVSPIVVKEGVERAVQEVMEELAHISVPMTPYAWMEPHVAEALKSIRDGGTILIEEGTTVETTIKRVNALELDCSCCSPYFSAPAKLSNAFVLLVDKHVFSIQEILPLLQDNISSQRPCLLIARGIAKDVLATLVGNKLQGILQVCAATSQEDWEGVRAFIGTYSLVDQAIIFEDKVVLIREEREAVSAIIHVGTAVTEKKKQQIEEHVHFARCALKHPTYLIQKALFYAAKTACTLYLSDMLIDRVKRV